MNIQLVNKTVGIALFCCMSLLSFGQEYLLKEDFNDNNNEWPFIKKGEKHEASISNGSLKWTNKDEGYQSTYTFTNEDWTKNFEIETKIKFIDGAKDDFIGVYFSCDDSRSSGYRFGLAVDGYYKVSNHGTGTTALKSGWVKTDLVKEKDYNILKVRKLGDEFFFFLNDAMVYYARGLQKNDGYVALNICEGTTVMFDYVYVKQITASEKETRALVNDLVSDLTLPVTIFDENFDNNENDWLEGEEQTYFAQIKKGSYLLASKKTGNTKWAYKTIEKLNWNLDFTVEAKVKRSSGAKNNQYGIVFGLIDADNYYNFDFSPNGYCRATTVQNEKNVFYKDWQKTDLVISDEYNTLTVEKVGDQLIYLLNNTPVFYSNVSPLLGLNAGIEVCPKGIIKCDQFKITQFYRSAKEQEKRSKELISKLEKVK